MKLKVWSSNYETQRVKLQDLRQNVALAPHTSWLVGGPAQYFAEPATVAELSEIQKLAASEKLKLTILGGGSNILVSDAGIKGLVVSINKLSGIEVVEEGALSTSGKTSPSATSSRAASLITGEPRLKFWALSGTPKSLLLKLFLKHKLAPACFLAGLPGQVGGGVVMNAGVSEKLMPREFCEIVEAVEVLRENGSTEVLQGKDLSWSYRHCHGWQPGVITRALISWPLEPDAEVLKKVKELNQRRLTKQPLEWPSGGSVFRNPLPQHAGQLIEQAGLKGKIIGDAQISEKHANFIINRGKAKAEDIRQLIELCKSTVKSKFGVELHTEIIWLE